MPNSPNASTLLEDLAVLSSRWELLFLGSFSLCGPRSLLGGHGQSRTEPRLVRPEAPAALTLSVLNLRSHDLFKPLTDEHRRPNKVIRLWRQRITSLQHGGQRAAEVTVNN